MNAETISWIYFWTAVGSGMAMLVWGAWLLISNMAGREDAEKNLAETSAALQVSESEVLRLRKEVRQLQKMKKTVGKAERVCPPRAKRR